jgi:beta-lactamase regulating signal transducer with metallopeptidase domain
MLAAWMDSPLTASAAALLLHLVWQGTLVGGAAALALKLAGRAAPLTRYWIAIAALAVIALLPLATATKRAEWFPAVPTLWPGDLAERLTPTAPAPGTGTARIDGNSAAPSGNELEARPHVTATRTRSGGGDRPISARQDLVRTAIAWLVGLWIVGVACALQRLVGGLFAVRRLRRSARSAPPRLSAMARELCQRLGMRTVVPLMISVDTDIPLACGILPPVVLFPEKLGDALTDEQTEFILAHELAHVRRCDYVVNVAQRVLESFLFFHPAVRWLSTVTREEREHCCDEIAAGVAGDGRHVAAALLALEELLAHRLPSWLAPAATGGALLRRVERLLEPAARHRRGRSAAAAVALTLGVAIVVIATPATARPAARSSARTSGVARIPASDRDGPIVWSGGIEPGEWLRIRNIVGPVRVVRSSGRRATVRAHVQGEALPDLAFTVATDGQGTTICALREAYGRCDAEGYTWFGTRDEMRRSRIAFTVELPAGVSVTAASFLGDLDLADISGDAEARTGDGAIAARIAPSPEDHTFDLHTGSGTVRVALPPTFAGSLEARLSHGRVEHDMPLDVGGALSPQRLHASIGRDGRNVLRASSGQGDLVLTQRR